MQIVHEQARRLIQFNADGMLTAPEKSLLNAHLNECRQCRAFADEIRELERLLLPVMKRQWNLRPIPFSIDGFVSKRNTEPEARILLATRKSMISLMAVIFIFGIWQFSLSGGPASSLPGIPPIPTPSLQMTGTQNVFEGCERMLYRVQGNDTLTGIASQFSVSKEMIMRLNHMKSETLDARMELKIPLCTLTPTTTYTPATEPITSTATRY